MTTASDLLNQLDLLRLQLVNVIETRPDAPVQAYIADCNGNTFAVSVDQIDLEPEYGEGNVTIAILSDDEGEFING